MTDVSRQANELLSAYIAAALFHEEKAEALKHKHGIANVLREMAKQLSTIQWEGRIEPDAVHEIGMNWARDALHVVATELENND